MTDAPASGAGAWVRAEAGGGRVALDPAQGNLRDLALRAPGRTLRPLHTAHWVGGPVPADLAAVEARLAGDFLCAPFGASDVEPAPPHGWPANARWDAAARGDAIHAVLGRPVMGARIAKTLRVAADAPVLYQTHRIEGGAGRLTAAHHPMIRCAAGGRATLSAKRAVLTPARPLEPGRAALRCPAEGPFDAFPGRAGPVDLGALPIGEGTEDFVTLIEAEGRTLGWTAVVRAAEDDVVVILKDPRVLPVTMLWHSNGGRDHAPWDGRHRGVLGIEDGRAAGADGHAAALAPNPVAARGVPTAFDLAPGRTHRIAHAILALPRDGWNAVADVALDGGTLVLTSETGARRAVPFDPHHFGEGG